MQHPMMQAQLAANPQMRALFDNPEMMQRMLDPSNMQAMIQMQQAMAQLQGAGLMPNLGGQVPGAAAGAPGTTVGPGAFDMSALLGTLGGAPRGQNETAGAAAEQNSSTAAVPATERYRTQLARLNEMGFGLTKTIPRSSCERIGMRVVPPLLESLDVTTIVPLSASTVSGE